MLSFSEEIVTIIKLFEKLQLKNAFKTPKMPIFHHKFDYKYV